MNGFKYKIPPEKKRPKRLAKRRLWAQEVAATHTDRKNCLRPPGHKKNDYCRVRHEDGRTVSLHRIVCEEKNGPPPSEAEKNSLHSCHNRWCCNPFHLRWGTHRENTLDALEAGSYVSGEAHYSSRLTENCVREIRARAAAGEGSTQIAKDYPVGVPAVTKVIKGRTWKGVR